MTERYKKVTAGWFVKYYFQSSHLDDDQRYKGLRSSVVATNGRQSLSIWHDGVKLPAHASDTDLAVVFAGSLHNSAELKDELCLQGVDDARTILCCFRKYSELAFQKIKGAYFLLVWDRLRDIVFTVRDRLAVVPVFYSINSDLICGTQTEVLIKYGAVSSQIDRLQLAQHLTNNLIDPERTYFSDIKQIPASTYLKFNKGITEKIKYWNRPDEPHCWASEDEVELFDSLFEKAVDRLLANKKAGVFLSGGLDSISVAAVMSRCLKDGQARPQALSLTFADRDLDESKVQTHVAKTLNYDLTLLAQSSTLEGQNALEAYLDMIRQWPSPNLSFWSPSFYRLAENGKESGCEVILTGSGGDEWLGVGPGVAVDYWRALQLQKLYNFWSTLCKSYYSSKYHNFKLIFWTYGLRSLLSSSFKHTLHSVSPQLFLQFTKKRLQKYLPNWAIPDTKLRQELLESISSYLADKVRLYKQLKQNYLVEAHFCVDHPLLSYEHEISYTMGERVGTGIFSPFMDSDLIDLMRRIRPEYLNRHGQLKSFLRDYIHNQFPSLEVQRQKKLISTVHYTTVLESHTTDALKKLQPFPLLTNLELVDKPKFDLYKEASLKDLIYWFHIRELMSLEVWLGTKFK